MTIAAGSRLGPYEILSPLGAGGMGEVYRARDTRLGREVAIKVMPEELSASPEMRQRFEREARAISQLSHPHICALYDVGSQDGVEYLVMELLEGETLAARLSRGPLPLEQVFRYGMEIADALDRAHRSAIVHRDLKPGNVMLTKSGVKLLDFGLARAVEHADSSTSLTSAPTAAGDVTREGSLVGTLAYMAPEQLEGKKADARTDIFALGAVLHEMATGRKAFVGASQASVIAAILTGEPPAISTIQRMSPPGLDRIVRRCLAKDPDRRWQSAGDVALELESAAESSAAGPNPPPRRRPAVWGAAGWVVAVLALLGGFLLRRPGAAPAPSSPMRFVVPPPPGAALAGMLALSPDGRALAFVATDPDGRDRLYVRSMDLLESRALAGTEGAAYPFWSPDGRSLAFFADGKLKRIEASGGAARTLCEASNPRGGSWGTLGSIVFSAQAGGQIEAVSGDGGEPRLLARLASRSGLTSRWPSFLPDGRHFLYVRLAGTETESGLHIASLDGTEPRRVAAADSGAFYASSGHLLYRTGDRLVALSFDLGTLAARGEPVPVVEDVWWDGTSTLATAFTVSSGGVLAYQTGGPRLTRLLIYDRTGREIATIGPSGGYFEPTLSPDGRRLAVTRAEGRGSAIWVMDVDRGTFGRLSPASGSVDATPLWMPDGRRVLYAVFPTGEVYARDADAAEPAKLLFKRPDFAPIDDVSLDGRSVLLETVNWPTFHFDVTIHDLATGAERPLLKEPFNEMGARLSPGGRWLAYESEESGVREVVVRSFPDLRERRQVSAGGGTQPRWTRDGRELFYMSPDRKLMAAAVRTAAGFEVDPPRALFQTRVMPTIETRNHYDAAPDGQRFVVNSSRPEDAALPITVVVNWSSALPRASK